MDIIEGKILSTASTLEESNVAEERELIKGDLLMPDADGERYSQLVVKDGTIWVFDKVSIRYVDTGINVRRLATMDDISKKVEEARLSATDTIVEDKTNDIEYSARIVLVRGKPVLVTEKL